MILGDPTVVPTSSLPLGSRRGRPFLQRMCDAQSEGAHAGSFGIAAELCPYYHTEPEYNEWHRGRLRTLIQRSAVIR